MRGVDVPDTGFVETAFQFSMGKSFSGMLPEPL
jgi:hypothetical protein